MKITQKAKRAADKALRMLARMGIDGFDAVEDRQYDNCFEDGDGDQVVCEIVSRALENPQTHCLLIRYPQVQYTCWDQWLAFYKANMEGGEL